MRKYYYPEDVKTWEATLLQSGGALPAYVGVPYQRGQGIGSFFKGLFRAIWPTVKKVAPHVGKELLRTGSEVISDVVRRDEPVGPTVKKRGRQALGRSLSALGSQLQEGEGIGYRKRQKSIKRVKTPKNKGGGKKRVKFVQDVLA